jgi:hypothetical protein
VPANKVVKPKKPVIKKAVPLSAPARPQQDRHTIIPEASSPAIKIDQAGPALSAAEAESQERQNWWWGPGERWKRRLRHLR